MTIPKTFQAWTYTSFNGKLEDSLKLQDRPTPQHFLEPKKGKVVVEVLATSLNPADYKIPESPIESRVVALKKPASPSFDFCGRLADNPDQLVYGKLGWPDQYGALGQYIQVTENDYANLPTGIDVAEAATLGVGPLTAYQSLQHFVKPGDRVLCNGGSGGVGTFTIQIAKLLGCHVVATCSTRNVDLCKDLGADQVIDYTKGDIVQQLKDQPPFDVFIDNVGNDTSLHHRSASIITKKGQYIQVSAMLGSFAGIMSMLSSILRPRWLGGARTKYSFILCKPDKTQLQQLGQWVAEKKLRIIIDEVFDFEDAPRAIAKLRTGRAVGKIVVRGA